MKHTLGYGDVITWDGKLSRLVPTTTCMFGGKSVWHTCPHHSGSSLVVCLRHHPKTGGSNYIQLNFCPFNNSLRSNTPRITILQIYKISSKLNVTYLCTRVCSWQPNRLYFGWQLFHQHLEVWYREDNEFSVVLMLSSWAHSWSVQLLGRVKTFAGSGILSFLRFWGQRDYGQVLQHHLGFHSCCFACPWG